MSKLVAEVNSAFNGFHFIVQAVRPPENWVGLVKAWIAARDEAQKRGKPFDEPHPPRGTLGSATFVRCKGELRDSGFVLKVSMQSEAGSPFVIFIEEQDMKPEMGVWERPNIEESIAAQLAFWTAERMCHSTAEDLDGRSISSGIWTETWT